MTQLEQQLTKLEFQFKDDDNLPDILHSSPHHSVVDHDHISVATEPVRKSKRLKSQISHSRHAVKEDTKLHSSFKQASTVSPVKQKSSPKNMRYEPSQDEELSDHTDVGEEHLKESQLATGNDIRAYKVKRVYRYMSNLDES